MWRRECGDRRRQVASDTLERSACSEIVVRKQNMHHCIRTIFQAQQVSLEAVTQPERSRQVPEKFSTVLGFLFIEGSSFFGLDTRTGFDFSD